MAAELTPFPDDHHAEYVEWRDYDPVRHAVLTDARTRFPTDDPNQLRYIAQKYYHLANWRADREEARTSVLWIVLLVGGISAPIWFVIGWTSRLGWEAIARLVGVQ